MKKILIIALVLTTFSCSNQVDKTLKYYPFENSQNEMSLLNDINNYRASLGVGKLVISQHVSYKCSEHNDYMIRMNTLTHNGFVERSENIQQVCGATSVGEVLACNFSTNESVLRGWKNSVTHDTVVKGTFNRVGISIKEDSNGCLLYTSPSPRDS